MADKYGKFQEMGVEVYSVSTDSHFVHKAWHDASETIRKIKYPMLADPTGALSRAFGVMIEEEGMAYRGTFLVNPEGKIKIAEIHDNESLKKVNPDYFYQCQNHMACTKATFCDFVAYCPFVENPMHIVRITRDNDEIALVEERVIKAEEVIQSNYTQINKPQRA